MQRLIPMRGPVPPSRGFSTKCTFSANGTISINDKSNTNSTNSAPSTLHICANRAFLDSRKTRSVQYMKHVTILIDLKLDDRLTYFFYFFLVFNFFCFSLKAYNEIFLLHTFNGGGGIIIFFSFHDSQRNLTFSANVKQT